MMKYHSKLQLIFAITLTFLVTCSYSKLAVKSPKPLGEKFDKINGIDYTVLTPQNKITYKRAFIGNLILSEPTHACDNLTAINTFGDSAVYNPILIAEWGDCHYAQKVKNAEVAGAKMLLLVLKHDMPLNHPSIRHLPMNTNIEVLAISRADGDKLISYLRDTKEMKKNDPNSIIEMTYSYDNEKHVNFQAGENAIIDFWFTTSDSTGISYMILEDLAETLDTFGERVEFYPHYVLWQCEECNAEGFSKSEPRCLSGGRYCDPEPLQKEALAGTQAVIEDLRQICFRESSGKSITPQSDWWKYVVAFGQSCFNEKADNLKACREDIFSDGVVSAKAAQQVEQCMQNSFKNKGTPIIDNLSSNEYLDKELALKDEMHVDHYPALYVNKEKYTGSFRNRQMLMNFICSHFLSDKMPAACAQDFRDGPFEHTHTDIAIYVVIVVASIILMGCMLYCVRRTVKRQVMVRMNDEISHIVTQYKQFKDKSSSFSHDDDDL